MIRRYCGADAGGEVDTIPVVGGNVPSEGTCLFCRHPAAGGKRGQDTKVSCPLLRLPNFPLSRDSLRSRGTQLRPLYHRRLFDAVWGWLAFGGALDFRAYQCAAAGYGRIERLICLDRSRNSPGRALSCAANHAIAEPRQTEKGEYRGKICALLVFSRECFAERPAEGQRGVKRGHRKPQVSYVPFCLRRQTAAMPGLPIGSHSRLQRQAAVSAERPTVSRRLKRASPAAAGRWNGGTVHPPAPVRELKAGAPGGACQRLIKVKA